jgi:Ca2+-binding RTX toxin-like protein
VPDDSLFFDHLVFAKLGKSGAIDAPVKLNAAFFKVGAKALDANDYLIYNPATGALFYDPDGTGKTAQVQVASLAKSLKLTAADFFVV